ncbi:unnamed protein product [Ectocarpus sp. 12 AP-2014]
MLAGGRGKRDDMRSADMWTCPETGLKEEKLAPRTSAQLPPPTDKTREWLAESETFVVMERSLLICAAPNTGSLQFRMLAKRIQGVPHWSVSNNRSLLFDREASELELLDTTDGQLMKEIYSDNGSGWIKIGVVRDPVTRLLSSYLDLVDAWRASLIPQRPTPDNAAQVCCLRVTLEVASTHEGSVFSPVRKNVIVSPRSSPAKWQSELGEAEHCLGLPRNSVTIKTMIWNDEMHVPGFDGTLSVWALGFEHAVQLEGGSSPISPTGVIWDPVTCCKGDVELFVPPPLSHTQSREDILQRLHRLNAVGSSFLILAVLLISNCHRNSDHNRRWLWQWRPEANPTDEDRNRRQGGGTKENGYDHNRANFAAGSYVVGDGGDAVRIPTFGEVLEALKTDVWSAPVAFRPVSSLCGQRSSPFDSVIPFERLQKTSTEVMKSLPGDIWEAFGRSGWGPDREHAFMDFDYGRGAWRGAADSGGEGESVDSFHVSPSLCHCWCPGNDMDDPLPRHARDLFDGEDPCAWTKYYSDLETLDAVGMVYEMDYIHYRWYRLDLWKEKLDDCLAG